MLTLLATFSTVLIVLLGGRMPQPADWGSAVPPYTFFNTTLDSRGSAQI